MNPEEVEPSDFSVESDSTIEVVDTDEEVTEPQGDTGGSPPGRLQARTVKYVPPGGAEQGESRWFRGQLVRRPWRRGY